MAAAPAVGSGGGGGGGLVEKLRELNDARSEGLIDDAEFESLKSAALGRLIGSAAVAPSSGPSVVIANVVEEELSPTRPQWQESSTGNGHGAPGEQWQISDSEGFF